MTWLSRLLVALALNTLVLLAGNQWISGFQLTGDFLALLQGALILTVLNFIIKPLLRLFLGPIIILTLGLGLILVNMILLLILDNLSPNLSIEGVLALVYGAVLLGAVNLIYHWVTQKKE